MMSLSNGTHSEASLGNLQLQNGHCPTPPAKLKYKRRRVCAVRDFPPGTGPMSSNSTIRLGTEAGFLIILENSVNGPIQSSQNEAESIAKPVSDSLMQEEIDGVQNHLDSVVKSPVLPSNQINECTIITPVPDQVDGFESRELESAELQMAEPVLNELSDSMNSDKMDLVESGEAQESIVKVPVSHSNQINECTITTPVPDQVDGFESRELESAELSMAEPAPNDLSDASETSDKMHLLESGEAQALPMSSPKDETGSTTGASEPIHQLDFAAKNKEIDLADLQVSCLPLTGSINGLGKTVKRNYPPRRKVSAVRDFPPFTGPNAPPLSHEQIKELFSAGLKISDVEKSGIERAAATGYEKQKIPDIQDEIPEPVKSKKFEGKDTQEKSEKFGCGDDAYVASNRTEGRREIIAKDIVVYQGSQNLRDEVSGRPGSTNQSQDYAESLKSKKVVGERLKVVSRNKETQISKSNDRQIVLGCPAIRKDRSSGKVSGRTNSERKSFTSRKEIQNMQLVVWDKEAACKNAVKSKVPHEVKRPRKLDVSLLPSCPDASSGACKDATGSRNKVKETLRLFQAICRKLLQEQEANAQSGRNSRVDYQASRILKEKGKLVYTGKQIIGHVPGIEVGDEFQYRVELNMIGLHKQIQGGIDYVREKGQLLATSIVASGGYDDDLENSDVLIYTGQGGNVMNGGKDPEDQKLERGNLALANSKDTKNPVRVIRGDTKSSDSSDVKGRTYIYDGLYEVLNFWQAMGPHGKLVFKFELHRIPGQPELSWKVVKKSKKSKFREGLCKLDISEGRERIPICAVNNIDDERPPTFTYTVGMIYPDWCRIVPREGCGCTTKCSESNKCSCVVKNGGEIPYNRDGAIVQAKPIVYECGPHCRCPPSCYNRVTQRGIRFQLEIFKTESRGWGVRSLDSIPSGSFICEYAGELLEEKEADRRTGNDEYLFDIGHKYNDNNLWDGVSNLMPDAQTSSYPVVEDGGEYTIDAALCGNIGRFVNHSCSPNLYAQNVLYDHEDTRIPHVMFFAMDNIPPLQELTYHYNYMIDQI